MSDDIIELDNLRPNEGGNNENNDSGEDETSFGGFNTAYDNDPDDNDDIVVDYSFTKRKKQPYNKSSNKLARGWEKIKAYFTNVKYENLDIAVADDGALGVSEKFKNKFTMVINSAGEIATRIPSRLRKLLGDSFLTKLQRNGRLNAEAISEQDRLVEENIKDAYDRSHDEETDNLDYGYIMRDDVQKRIDARNEQIDRLQNEIDERNRKDMNIIKRLPIKERVRAIFKKYGLTIASIMLAIWAVVATIIGATQSTTVGDKKQDPKVVSIPSIRLNSSIPTAPIIDFIFDAALEVIEELVENSFLLIELLVIFYIDKR